MRVLAADHELFRLLEGWAVIGEVTADLLEKGMPIAVVYEILLARLTALVASVDLDAAQARILAAGRDRAHPLKIHQDCAGKNANDLEIGG